MSAKLWLPNHCEMHEKDKKVLMEYCLERYIKTWDKGFITNCDTAHFITNRDKGLLKIETAVSSLYHVQIATRGYYKLRQLT